MTLPNARLGHCDSFMVAPDQQVHDDAASGFGVTVARVRLHHVRAFSKGPGNSGTSQGASFPSKNRTVETAVA